MRHEWEIASEMTAVVANEIAANTAGRAGRRLKDHEYLRSWQLRPYDPRHQPMTVDQITAVAKKAGSNG